jgi:NodT family efflux transporter outer membrane factor (OMF) lipoprotein
MSERPNAASLGMAGAALATLLLAACGAPAYQPPATPVPAAFREAADTAHRVTPVLAPAAIPGDTTAPGRPDAAAGARIPAAPAPAGFWTSLGDSTLDRLVAEATRVGFDVRAAEARLRGARAQRTLASLDFAPTVTVAGGYTRQRLAAATFGLPAGSIPDQDLWDAGFDASWEVDLFGRLRGAHSAQQAFVQSSEESLRDVQVSLAAEVARSYFELRGAQEQLLVAERNAANQRRTLELTQERLDAGRGTAFDTERARAQLNTTLAAIPALQANVAAAEYAIGVLVGRSPEGVAAELATPEALPPLPASVALAAADSVVRHRPDVAAAERIYAGQRALVGSAKADYLPRLTVGGSVGFTSTTLDAWGERGSSRFAVGPVLSWPALNLARVKARVDASRAIADEARAGYEQAVLRATAEVETSLARYRSARSRLDLLAEAASASERAAELARLRFTEGVADFLQVLDAERTLLLAQDDLARGRADAATAYAALYKAAGGAPGVATP